MVKLQILFKADLERVTTLSPASDIQWNLKVKCSNCGEENEKWVGITSDETSSMNGSRGTANLVMKCKFCKRENSIDIVEGSSKHYTFDDSGKFVPLITFDCRGVDITAVDLRTGFVCEGEKRKQFNVDFSDGDWVDFDESINESIGIYNPTSKIEKTK